MFCHPPSIQWSLSMTLKQTSRSELNVCATRVSSSLFPSLFHMIMAEFAPTLEIKCSVPIKMCKCKQTHKNRQMQKGTYKLWIEGSLWLWVKLLMGFCFSSLFLCSQVIAGTVTKQTKREKIEYKWVLRTNAKTQRKRKGNLIALNIW